MGSGAEGNRTLPLAGPRECESRWCTSTKLRSKTQKHRHSRDEPLGVTCRPSIQERARGVNGRGRKEGLTGEVSGYTLPTMTPKSKRLPIVLPPETYDALRDLAATETLRRKQTVTMSQLGREAIEALLKRRK